jgi:polar amino acid transport system substrate-binding protein
MLKKLSIALLGLVFALSLPRPSLAETVMEKVARTGVLTVGSITDLVPLVYVNDKGELVGYSVDIINLVKEELEQRLGKPITLEIVEVNPQNRIPKVVAHEVDISCDVGFTWERDKFVDFSLSYFITGSKLLVKKGSNLGSPESLSGKRIGAIPQTLAEQAIKLVQPQVNLVAVENLQQGFTALEQGKIDAFAGDGVLLEGFRQTVSQPDAFQVVPQQAYSREGVACIFPEENSKFQDLVNYTLVKLMQGYLDGEPRSVETVNRWFGPDGVVTIDPNLIRSFFTQIVTSREQIRLSK